MKIILGSSSPSRQKILREAGFDFSVMSPDIDEKQIRHADPAEMVMAIAQAKAAALLPRIHHAALLITVDQIVVCDQHVHEKPHSLAEAQLFLQRYAHHPAEVLTAVVVTNTITRQAAELIDISRIYFDSALANRSATLTVAEVDFACAGGFQIEGAGLLAPYIVRVEGTLDSIIGIPVALTQQLLAKVS